MYSGKRRDRNDGDSLFEHKTGAAAVARNLKIVLSIGTRHAWHMFDIDHFYSSILLAIELLVMQVYVLGTIMTDRHGYDVNIKEKRKSRPATIPRGTFTFSRSVTIPSMVAFHWRDRKPVHDLYKGSTMTQLTIGRNIKPQSVVDQGQA
ncbi:unnamed protein product [Phytophthora fragariaefolia]|uniref:Unnamed protein product n=1 Tax=Phytophthora fragariaefolia TaxID=1490495 RepID=A0A9W6XMX2_9STRA|nr:unnamed protein product [Phytophthora fragariaefolia]